MNREYLKRASEFAREAEKIFATCESSTHRIITLDESFTQLNTLSISQQGLFEEALNCVSFKLYRAAHVMAWAAFMDFLLVKLDENYIAVKNAFPKWKSNNSHELREEINEFQILEAGKKVKLYTIKTKRIIESNLQKRNDCAHPTGYEPDLNNTLGYIKDLFDQIGKINYKSPDYP